MRNILAIVIVLMIVIIGGGLLLSQSQPELPINNDNEPADESAPLISAINPSRGPVGTVVTITGKNLAGFEGDLDAWIENAAGERAYLPAYGPSAYPRADQITVQIAEKLCRENNSYSGNPCSSELTITPGSYKIWTAPWGKESNRVDFEVIN